VSAYSAGELAAARANARQILTGTAEVWRRPDPASDNAGGQTSGSPVLNATYAAALDFATGREQGAVTRGLESGLLLLPHDASLRITDTVKVGGLTWQVRGTNEAETDRLLCEATITRAR
jgi:hypothetical protein